MSLRVAGIQPGYLPWLGYFDQMLRVDLFVVADEMPFSRSGWTHRNRLLGANGPFWLHLPVRPRPGQRIDEVALGGDPDWSRTHLRSMQQAYAHSPHAAPEVELLRPLLEGRHTSLVDVVVPTLRHLVDRLGITTPLIVSSEAGLEARYRERFADDPGATQRIVAFLEALGADRLLEGASGRSYLDVELCRRHGIEVEFHDYDHPVYEQRPGQHGFVSHLSVLDLLLTHGPDHARRVLHSAAGCAS